MSGPRHMTPEFQSLMPGETSTERYWRKRRNELARARADAYNHERCAQCGYARANVVHEEDPDTAPEGPDYYRDMDDRHRFVSSGEMLW